MDCNGNILYSKHVETVVNQQIFMRPIVILSYKRVLFFLKKCTLEKYNNTRALLLMNSFNNGDNSIQFYVPIS